MRISISTILHARYGRLFASHARAWQLFLRELRAASSREGALRYSPLSVQRQRVLTLKNVLKRF